MVAIDKKSITVPLFKNPLKNAILGLILGIVWIGGTTLPLYLSGHLVLGNRNEISYLAVWFVAVLLNATMQEYLMRGYLFALLKDKYNLIVATAVTTIIFTAMHGGAFEAGAVAVFNVVTMSVFVSLLLIYTESLLAPIIVHFIWNAAGRLVFGVVSLADDYPCLWNGAISGNEFISGGAAKLEGSIVVSIANSLLIVLLGYLIVIKKRHHKA